MPVGSNTSPTAYAVFVGGVVIYILSIETPPPPDSTALMVISSVSHVPRVSSVTVELDVIVDIAAPS